MNRNEKDNRPKITGQYTRDDFGKFTQSTMSGILLFSLDFNWFRTKFDRDTHFITTNAFQQTPQSRDIRYGPFEYYTICRLSPAGLEKLHLAEMPFSKQHARRTMVNCSRAPAKAIVIVTTTNQMQRHFTSLVPSNDDSRCARV